MDNSENLAGKRILLTGAAGHLGSALAVAAAQSGAYLYLTDKDRADLDRLSELLTKSNCRSFEIFAVDLESTSSRERFVEELRGRTAWLDGLVHNAAFVGTDELDGWAVGFQEQSLSTWRRALEVNLTAPFHLTQMLAPFLSSSESASVVSVGSIHGVIAPDWGLYEESSMASPAAYSASKAALIHLAKWLSTSLGPKIRSNSVSPGGLFRNQDLRFIERYRNKVPANRMGIEDDIVPAILFLLSESSSYVRGQNLIVDGGYTSW